MLIALAQQFNFINYVYNFVNYVFFLLCYVFLLLHLCILIVLHVPLRVFCFIVLFCVLLVCKCVLYYSYQMSTQLQFNKYIIPYRINGYANASLCYVVRTVHYLFTVGLVSF